MMCTPTATANGCPHGSICCNEADRSRGSCRVPPPSPPLPASLCPSPWQKTGARFGKTDLCCNATNHSAYFCSPIPSSGCPAGSSRSGDVRCNRKPGADLSCAVPLPPPPPPQCAIPSDIPLACNVKADCGNDLTCQGGICRDCGPPPPPPTAWYCFVPVVDFILLPLCVLGSTPSAETCLADSDCPGGSHCTNGACLVGARANSVPASTGACQSPSILVNGACCSPEIIAAGLCGPQPPPPPPQAGGCPAGLFPSNDGKTCCTRKEITNETCGVTPAPKKKLRKKPVEKPASLPDSQIRPGFSIQIGPGGGFPGRGGGGGGGGRVPRGGGGRGSPSPGGPN